jgi:DNA-binding NarL/FixJ family response regulator
MTGNQKAQCLLIATPSAEVTARWQNTVRDFDTVRNATDFQQAQREIDDCKPSIVLFDSSLPPNDSMERFAIILRNRSAFKMIVFSNNPSEKEAVRALKMGARGYAPRDLDSVLLKKAIHVVLKGELWISRNTISHLVQEVAETGQKRGTVSLTGLGSRRRQFSAHRRVNFNRLTSREQEIALLIGNGSSNKEIASRLKISESTVKAHLSAIYHKLGLIDRLSLGLLVAEQVRNVEQAKQISRD